MFKFKYDSRDVLRGIEQLHHRVSDLSPAFRDMSQVLLVSTKKRFETSTAPDGSTWAPNKESTLIHYLQKRGGLTGKKAARATANKKPLIGLTRRLSNEILVRVYADRLEVGTNVEYAATQQFGAKQGAYGRNKRNHPIPWGDIKARPFLGTSEDDLVELKAILKEHLTLHIG